MNGASYDPASRTWAMLRAGRLPDPNGPQAIVWTGTQMVVIQPGTSATFDPATNSWTTVPALPLGIDSAEWTGSEVIAWVASGAQASVVRLSAYSWVPGSGAWTSLPGQPGDGWPFGTAASIGGRLLFLGGVMPCGVACPAQNLGDGDWFDPSSGMWISLPEKFSGGFGPAVWTGSAMVVFATKAGASSSQLVGPRIGPPTPAGAAAAFDPSTPFARHAQSVVVGHGHGEPVEMRLAHTLETHLRSGWRAGSFCPQALRVRPRASRWDNC